MFGNLCHWTDFVFRCIPDEARYPILIRTISGAIRDSDIALSFSFGDGSVASIVFSAKGTSLEGVRERLTAQSGDTIVFVDDFSSMTVEQAGRTTRYSPLFRNHGHLERVRKSYGLSQGEDPEIPETRYLLETGLLFLRAKDALDSDREVVIEEPKDLD